MAVWTDRKWTIIPRWAGGQATAKTGNSAERNDVLIWAKSTRNGSRMFNVAVATIILTRDYLLGVMCG